MTITSETTVGTIATEHPLATRVFARHGMDFCCGGGQPLHKACESRGVSLDKVLEELEHEIAGAAESGVRWDLAPLEELVAHILEHYHRPLREELPRLEAMAQKVNEVHGSKDPERLGELLATITALRGELEQHMRKEEMILFPMILEGEGNEAGGPIHVMEMEHQEAGAMLARLRELTGDYIAPAEACNTWNALWAGLADLERSLHEHIHLENNILHVRALAS